jgi:hypothetical protein
MAGQYYVLPSNSSLEYFPHNTMAEFSVRLPRPLRLNGPHEVALMELIYPYSFDNVEVNELAFWAWKQENDEDSVDQQETQITQYFPQGSYAEPIAMLREFDKMANPVKLSYHTNRKRFKLFWPKKRFDVLSLTSKLAHILGYGDGTTPVVLYKPEEASRPPNYICGYSSIFVYSNIVDYQPVGHSMAQLLRIVVPDSEKRDQMCSEKFVRPMYMPMCLLSTDVITVRLKSIDGSPFPFVTGSGHVIAKLHIRPRRLL